MARDNCVDCETHYPGGEGLTEGRCPPCRKAYLARRRAAAPAKAAAKKKGK